MIIAVNNGNHAKPAELKRTLDKLTKTKPKSMSVDDALKMARK